MALQTVEWFWSNQGKVVVNITYDDGTLDVRSVTVTNTTTAPATWKLVDRQNRETTASIPPGTQGLVVTVQRNRFTYIRNAEGALEPQFTATFIGAPGV